ncbi:baseplate J/gp47 family protein [Pedobacter alluvionis]|uniref:Baseplate J-like protein n=1 Tax=Pedobacter alluvionis TaxID=475253 RepID=A0A497YD88_9SPHI|nr:baseplate J/gp47 family protein [Pedobacter alluvionis]RLJ80648.1 baseplate J-like protein [Pedobacter alluvionis]TFB31905.1 hypothetical protein E3V97_15145 [Pedobacter alluvionis]
MKLVNANSILNSVAEALHPGASLIDGRTEQDWLRFLSEFATLINFYDQDNVVHGNWEPFILKDPVFLMATIAGTNFTKLYNLYLHTCHKLERQNDLGDTFNQLFDQLTFIFIKIQNWMHYMQQSAANYPLKTYVGEQIRDTFADALQAIIDLRQALFSSAMLVGIVPTNPAIIWKLDTYEYRIWREGVFKGPYWKLMSLLPFVKDNAIVAIFKAVTHIGDALFNFLQVIVKQANIEYDHLSKLKGSFPDTTLLRTFIHLLKVQQTQLNQISDKHLNFYYRDILKQTERKATADRAYLTAGLAIETAVVNLPKGTLFDAGTDPQKNPIVFASTDDVILNPAVIPLVYTLSRAPAANQLSYLQLQTIADPGVVQKDPAGAVLSWDTLGNHQPNQAIQQALGIAFASPMLLLREGTRQLKLSLTYSGTADLNMLRDAKCYLSTLKDWFEVSADFQLNETDPEHAIIITIVLQSTDPAIERFLINPDGVVSDWPMFKLVFNQVTPATVAPPILQRMKIEVNVTGMETFQLYNDYGALSTKVAFPLFGPTPAYGSNFIIGSNEIFSKPVNSLKLALNWSALPPDFSCYYQAYNLYINKKLNIAAIAKPSLCEKIFGKKQADPVPFPELTEPYNNKCFVVGFQVLEEKNWKSALFNTLPPVTQKTADTVTTASMSDQPVNEAATNLLFVVDNGEMDSLSSYESTSIPLSACNPDLQNQPMKFTEASTGGFIKMDLQGPDYGFGPAVYPNVVSAVAIYNSQILYNNENVTFVAAAQLPFTPKLKSFSASYAAAVEYVFNSESKDAATIKDYPVQAFLYTPFVNYVVYDNLNQPPAQKYTIGDVTNNQLGIPLYASYNYDGYLYLTVDHLIPASSFNIYFELTRKYVMRSPVAAEVSYYYLGTEGWAPLIVLTDGTDNLTSSGIVTLSIPANITLTSMLMPPECYWITIVANDISHIAATVLLSTNGISVQRLDTAPTDAVNVPVIAANTITKTKSPLPKISTVQQPFPSFGGKVAENALAMNWRVSNRIKTKDRATTASDYIRLIKQEFNGIYDAAVIYNPVLKCTQIYVVKAVDSWMAAHAFLPMVSVSEEENIQRYLKQKTSAFSEVKVSNPDFQSVTVYAVITVQQGYEFSAVRQTLTHALNIYLSPWIKSTSTQVEIYQEITDVQVAAFIKNLNGVAAVENVAFKTWMYHPELTGTPVTASLQTSISLIKKSALFISNLVHQISLKPLVL